jgi:hypothetical protein
LGYTLKVLILSVVAKPVFVTISFEKLLVESITGVIPYLNPPLICIADFALIMSKLVKFISIPELKLSYSNRSRVEAYFIGKYVFPTVKG